MRTIRVMLRSAGTGALAGLGAFGFDLLLDWATQVKGLPLVPTVGFLLVYVSVGALLGLVVLSPWSFERATPPPSSSSILVVLALLYAMPLVERCLHLSSGRHWGGSGTGALVAAGILVAGVWVGLLRAVSRSSKTGLLLGVATVAIGLVVNRNLIDSTLSSAGLRLDFAVAAGALALAAIARLRPATARIALVVLLALGGVGGAVARHLLERGAARPELLAAGRPDILLVVIDTMRKDVFESVVEETPEGRRLGDFLAGATWFDHAVAAAPWTVPAMTSMLTGLAPVEHGCGYRSSGGHQNTAPLPAGLATLADELRSAGYWTEAMIANPILGPFTGLDRGFAHYELPWVAWKRMPLTGVVERLGLTDAILYPAAATVSRRLAARLPRLAARRQPVFLWLHLMDPHSPLHEHAELTPDVAVSRLPRLERLYRGEARSAIAAIASFLERWRALGRWRRTLLVVTADHGEMFPSDHHDNGVPLSTYGIEHYGHGTALYDELIHVPLVIHGPGATGRTTRVAALVAERDLAATVLDLAGVRRHEGFTDEGPSLAALVGGEPAPPTSLRRFAISGATLAGPRERALVTADWKLITYPDGERPAELYDLAADPREQDDLSLREPARVKALADLLAAAWGRFEKRAAPGHRPVPNPQEEQALRALGYL